MARDVDAFMRTLPEAAQQAWKRVQAGEAVPLEFEDAHEVGAWVRWTQERQRVETWRRLLDTRWSDFADAQVEDFGPEQDPDAKVRQWLGSGHQSLLLVGDTGKGKTHAAVAIGNAAVERGERPLSVELWTAPELNKELRPSNPHYDRVMDRVIEAELFIVEDLGIEKISEWTLQEFYTALNARYRNRRLGRRNVITTNLPYDRGEPGDPGYPSEPNMVDRYDSRIAERIIDDAVIVRLQGPSRRAPARW